VARKGPLNKLVNAAFGAVKDPVGATGKTLGVAKEAAAIGWMLAGQVTRLVVDKAAETAGGSSGKSAPTHEADAEAPSLRSVPPVTRTAEPASAERSAPPVPAQSSDPATTGAPAKKAAGKVPAQKVPARKVPAQKAPAKKAPATTAGAPKAPAGRAPAKKTPAKKTPAKKASAKVQGDPTMVTPADIAENVSKQPAKKVAKKAPAKKSAAKAPAKKSPAKKATPATVAKKASAKKTAKKAAAKTAEQVANVDGPPVTTPVGTTAAAQATNPDTTEHDLQQPGTEPIVDSGTAKAIRKEAETLQRAADTDKS
jgi:hypothetical protein